MDKYSQRKRVARELNAHKRDRLREDNLYFWAALSVLLSAALYGAYVSDVLPANNKSSLAGRIASPDFLGRRILVANKNCQLN